MRDTFVGQKHLLWLWLTVASLLAMIGVYLADHPIGGRSGATRLGIAYGCVAAAAILFLMWYGIRKRYSYARGSFTLRTWLGPHVWIGLALALVVPLHCGFKIRWNLHAAPYLIMLLTIVSGVWGAYAYLRLPSEMTARREGITLKSCCEQIEAVAAGIASLAKKKSEIFRQVAAVMTVEFKPSFARVLLGRRFHPFTRPELSTLLARLPDDEFNDGLQLTSLAGRRIDLANRMIAEASVAAQLRIWLYFHVPLSFGCVIAVAAHVFWVLYYRWPAR